MNYKKHNSLGKNFDVRAMALTPCFSGLFELPRSGSMRASVKRIPKYRNSYEFRKYRNSYEETTELAQWCSFLVSSGLIYV